MEGSDKPPDAGPANLQKKLGHFEIIERLGQGGMGEVFKARDLRLGRLVALKVLARDAFHDEVARRRFVQEARLAASITHPHVATIHEIDEENGTPFIAMELVPGRNLKQVLETGPLSVEHVLHVGRQVCDALAQAHAKGIIHRDIKSSNIMITPNGQAKVLDFGLAKPLFESTLLGPKASPEADGLAAPKPSAKAGGRVAKRDDGPHAFMDDTPKENDPSSERTSEPITRQGVAVGTVSYMSPEQASGREVDPRTDIFSLGVVLYEASCGQLPFRGKTDRELLLAIRNEDPPPPHLSGARVPVELSQVITRCLKKRPSERYGSAADLGAEIARIEQRSTGQAAEGREQRAVGWRWVALGVGLPLGLLALWTKVSPGRSGARVPGGTRIVLASIENRTADPQLDAVGMLLETELRQSAHVQILDPAGVRDVLRRMTRPDGARVRLDLETAREVAWREGIPIVAAGALFQMGESYVLSLRVDRVAETPAEPSQSWSKTFRAESKEGIYAVVDEGSLWVRAQVGEAQAEVAARDLPIQETTTPYWEALDLYFRAEQAKVEERDDDAVLLLKEATMVDPDFAKAYVRLGDILTARRQFGEGFRYWQKALGSARRRSLTQRERLHLTSVYANDRGDYRAAEEAFRAYSVSYPYDYYPVFGHAMSLLALGRAPEAIERFRQAQGMQRPHFAVPLYLAMTHLITGDFTEAGAEIERLRGLDVPDWPEFLSGIVSFTEGGYDAALGAFSELSRSRDVDWQSRGHSLRAFVLGELGRTEEAIQALREGISLDELMGKTTGRADKLLALAYVHYLKGNLTACRNFCLEALRGEPGADTLRQVGPLLARAGFAQDADRLLSTRDAGRENPRLDLAWQIAKGEVLLAKGDPRGAIELFRGAAARQPFFFPREFLAHGLKMSGDRAEALALYRTLSQFPFDLRRMQYPGAELLPGSWAISLLESAKLAASLGKDEEARRALRTYARLREHSPTGLEQLSQAKALLRKLDSLSNE